jgi:hypothetical protein
MALAVNLDPFEAGINQLSLESAPVINRRTGSHVDNASHIPLKVFPFAKRPVQARRRNLKVVLIENGIRDVEEITHNMTYPSTIIHCDTILLVNEQAQHPSMRFAPIFELQEFNALRTDNRFDKFPELRHNLPGLVLVLGHKRRAPNTQPNPTKIKKAGNLPTSVSRRDNYLAP